MIPGAANPLLLASAQAGAAYNIERSVRFNAPDSAYLSRTPSVAGNRKTWTWAGWVKRSGSWSRLFTGGPSLFSDLVFTSIGFHGDKIVVNEYKYPSAVWGRDSVAVFRDYSAWYHIVVAVDTTQATDTNRVKLYVNGVEQSTVTRGGYSAFPVQNADTYINTTTQHQLSASNGTNSSNFYLADIHFIDGQALTPSSFGQFDANGVWQPKAYTGTYGTNGFHLPFSDNSTAAALGTDTSGNSNNWTVNNISVTAGAGNDSLVDTPTSYGTDTGAGGEVRGNYATFNNLLNTSGSYANGNLERTQSDNFGALGTICPSSGKWYAEFVYTAIGSAGVGAIVCNRLASDGANGLAQTWQLGSDHRGFLYNAGSSTSVSSYTTNDVIGLAFDCSTGAASFYKNGTLLGTITNVAFANVPVGIGAATGGALGSNTVVANFGQRPWTFTPPAGFKALCTTDLPEPQTVTTSGSYTGNGLADGPFVYLNGVPTAMTVNGTAVTFGTHADKLSNGFKLRTTSTTYNQNAATYNYSVTSTGPTFKTARAQSN